MKIGSGLQRLELEQEAGADLEFLDRTLVVAEIELPALDMDVELPPWRRDVMGREVADEPGYANAHLAR